MIKFYNKEIFNVDRQTFGGYVFPSDFNTEYRGNDNLHGSVIAERIASDRTFDRRCKRATMDRLYGRSRKIN